MVMLETDRLLLRPPLPEDLDPLAQFNGDPEVMRFIGDGSVRDREQTAAGLERATRDWAEHGYGMFSLVVKDTGNYVGWVTLTEPAFLPEILPAVEIGWRLGQMHWGHGYATEGALATLHFGLIDCDLDRVVSIRHRANEASKRVMDKIGLRFSHDTVVPATGQEVAVHELTRAEYRSRL